MKKSILAAIVAVFAVLALAGPASAQSPGQQYCGPGVGYADVCPDDLVRPDVDPDVDADVVPASTGTLPRTGSDSSLPMARIAIALIGVGAGLSIMAGRKRMAHVTG